MALLVYSDKCKWSQEVIGFIKTNPALVQSVRFHNITTNGVPSSKITRVPTLVTDDGIMKVGSEVKAWLTSMIPDDFESWDVSTSICANLDGSDRGDMFNLDMYGASLQPTISPELQAKIDANPQQAYQSIGARTT
jgi:hypothetical protein